MFLPRVHLDVSVIAFGTASQTSDVNAAGLALIPTCSTEPRLQSCGGVQSTFMVGFFLGDESEIFASCKHLAIVAFIPILFLV